MFPTPIGSWSMVFSWLLGSAFCSWLGLRFVVGWVCVL